MYFLPFGAAGSDCVMKRSRVLLVLGAAWSFSAAANLQPQDLFFISTHRYPTQIVSDDKVAYVLTENGVLYYDYNRDQWMDDIGAGLGVSNIAYLPDKNLLLLATPNGTLEYNPVFRQVTPSSVPFQGTSAAGGNPGDLNGLQLGNDYTYLTQSGVGIVRDRYNRRDSVSLATVFNYDHLWVLTSGGGAFLGSARRKEADSKWFGLYDSSVTSVFSDGKQIWFGSPNPAGALVQASIDLSTWKTYASQQDYDFINGSISDIAEWRGYLWLATGEGVVRQDLQSGQFHLYQRMQGSTGVVVTRLFVHQDQLYAGTANGIAVMDDPDGQFHNSDLPLNVTFVGNDFCSKDSDLWAATSLGLFVLQKNGWKSIKDVTKQDVPDAVGEDVPSVAFHDSSLYWASAARVYEKPRRQETAPLFDVPSPGTAVFRISFDGDNLFAGFDAGVRVFNVKTRLYADFLLSDGIPGTKVQSYCVNNGFLWIGTDFGVMRIALKSYLP